MEETIKYRCTNCKQEEDIPKEVVEYFDEMDQSNINELLSQQMHTAP